jgi:hypothetical protein
VSNCCTTNSEQACPVPQDTPAVCPGCGRKGQAVSVLTVKSLVRTHTRVSPRADYKFCRSPECDVVYFSTDAVFRKPDVKIRVGLKERQDPIPLCYCFDYTREDVRRDIDGLGQTDIPLKIKAETNAGFCACQVKNPSGKCCLGEMTKAAQEEKALWGSNPAGRAAGIG